MKKISVFICIIFLSVFFAGTVFAANENAYFLLDTDLATAGYQGMGEVMDIGGTTKVGFAIYAKGWDNSAGLIVKFEWDGTKAEFRGSDSTTDMVDDELTVNGADEITLAEEDNILAASLISSGVQDTDGFYTIAYARSGGGKSEAAEGLIYLAVFRTADTFKITDALTIKASVTVADDAGNERFLGTRYFHVNVSVGVEEATWGEVKKQYKDF